MPKGLPTTLAAAALAALAAGLTTGCQSSSRRAAYADNPLLLSRQPVPTAPSTSGGDRLAQIAHAGPHTVLPPPIPVPTPPVPPVLLAKSAVDGGRPGTDAAAVPVPSIPFPSDGPKPLTPDFAPVPEPAQPLAAAPPPVAFPAPGATEAAESPPAAPRAGSAANRRADGKYGAASDHTWLQGELDRHYRGHMDLRFRAPSEEDAFGGKVRLENDPRLAEFRAGDIVLVEGELIRDPDRSPATGPQYPRYHVRDIRLIERK